MVLNDGKDSADKVAESGRRTGRAELRALILGGAVWGNFRENENCGDPVGTLRGNCGYPVGSAYISPGPNWEKTV